MSFAIQVCIKATVLLICAGFLSRALVHSSASIRHAIWAAALIASLALPVISAIVPAVALVVLPSAEQPATHLPVQTAFADTPALDHPVAANSARWGSAEWLLFLWCAGACIVLFPVTGSLWNLYRLKDASNSAVDGSWAELLAEIREKLSVYKPVDLVFGANPGPLTTGILRHTILLPQSATDWSPDRCRLVLAHEMAHVKRNDGLGQLFSQIVCAVYWFNPLVWYAVHRLQIERERACDDYVLGLGASAPDYANHLLQITRDLNNGLRSLAVSMAHPSQLKSRIVAILDSRTRRRATTRFTTVTLLITTAVFTAGLGSIQFTRLAAIPLPMLALAIPSPALTLKTPPASIAKTAESPAQKRRYVLKHPPIPSQPTERTDPGSAQISGKTVDASRAPLSGVIIAATNSDSGISITTVTDQDGTYAFRKLGKGQYRLNVRLTGFQDQSFDAVRLDDAQQVRLNFRLEASR